MALKVSVIIPTFNRQSTILRALDSVLAQTYQNFEILVCDDASSDETYELVSAYSQKARQIRLLSLPYNQGAASARNLGMRMARGEYLAFLDSDDEWRPEKLARQVRRMDQENVNVAVCFCGATIIKNGNLNDTAKYVPDVTWEKDTFRKFVCDFIRYFTPTIMIRKICLADSGMMVPEMRRNQDGEFLLRLFINYGLAVIQEDLAIVHLDTQPGHKKQYEFENSAYPFLEQHAKMIRIKSGLLASTKYLSTRRTNLVASAIRERLWRDAWRDFLMRLSIAPFFWPIEIEKILRSLYSIIEQRWLIRNSCGQQGEGLNLRK